MTVNELDNHSYSLIGRPSGWTTDAGAKEADCPDRSSAIALQNGLLNVSRFVGVYHRGTAPGHNEIRRDIIGGGCNFAARQHHCDKRDPAHKLKH